MTASNSVTIAGGGFCALMVAVQLAKLSDHPLQINIHTGGAAFPGRGVAYGTPHAHHLLNVPADRMGAFPDDPAHFYNWLQGQQPDGADRQAFLPRGRYGDYLEYIWQAVIRSDRHQMQVTQQTLDSLPESGVLVLATGPVMQVPHWLPDDQRVLANPWGEQATGFWQRLQPDATVVILGTGLTAVDMVLSLAARGHRGRIIAVSRHGQWPLVHDLSSTTVPWPDGLAPATAGGLSDALNREPGNLHGVIDGVRPQINRLWAGLPDHEKQRFMAQHFSWWNTHRHRMPPSSAATLARLAADGQLQTVSGSIKGISAGAGLTIQLDGQSLVADAMISTMGFSFALKDSPSRLLRDLLRTQRIAPGPLGLGLATADGYRVGRGGNVPIYALGQCLFGERFETTAVPELRQQALDVARLILS